MQLGVHGLIDCLVCPLTQSLQLAAYTDTGDIVLSNVDPVNVTPTARLAGTTLTLQHVNQSVDAVFECASVTPSHCVAAVQVVTPRPFAVSSRYPQT